MRQTFFVAVITLFQLTLGPAPAWGDENFVWWEAESPEQTTFPKRSAFSIDTPGDWSTLSGGDWLSSAGPAGKRPLAATYAINVPQAGEHQFWVRKFWKHGPFHWRFGERPWQTVSRDVALADRQNIRESVEVDWIYIGQVELPAGPTSFEIRLAVQPGEDTAAAFDCFLLSREAFFPHGPLKPGQSDTRAAPGWFAFNPPTDPFADDALLDLRRLNESAAGVNGPLGRTADGNGFALGDGTPVRFWAVNLSSNQAGQSDAQVKHMARRLAKLGVNMVRYHGAPWIDHARYQLDPPRLARIQHLVAALKQQGIYTHLSWYFPLWIHDASVIGLEGYADRPADSRKPFAVLFFNETAQKHYLDTMRQFMGTPDPKTGLTLAQDPAVGIIELCNEDSLFFWTFNRKLVPETQWKLLEERFAEYLIAKHGSLAAALRRWPRAKHPRDDAAAKRIGVDEAWHMTADAREKMSRDQRKRIAEQVEFLAGLQRNFYAKATAVLRDELGYRGQISASNWHTADPSLTDAVERWTYTTAGVMDRHGYFGGKHEGSGAGYSVRAGHTYRSRAVVLHPEELPLRTNQVAGYPQIISEMGWTNPNRFRADATLLTAATAAQQGVDGVFFFAWDAATGIDTMANKFAVGTPIIAGLFPANALLYRQGHLPEAPVAVHEALRTANLFNLKGTAAVTPAAYDAFRKTDVPAGAKMRGDLKRFDPLTAYVGRVTRSFDQRGDVDVQLNLRGAIDRKNKILTGLHGYFVWDYGRGLVAVDTPAVQAIAGFLARTSPTKLADVTIISKNEYGQIAVASLDGLPLKNSKLILIQAASEERLFGYGVDHGKITTLGRPPWNLKRLDATVTLRLEGQPVRRVVALDGNGQAVESPVVFTGDGVVEPLVVTLPADRLYTVIQR